MRISGAHAIVNVWITLLALLEKKITTLTPVSLRPFSLRVAFVFWVLESVTSSGESKSASSARPGSPWCFISDEYASALPFRLYHILFASVCAASVIARESHTLNCTAYNGFTTRWIRY